jgi:phosphoglycerate dehydrogenase-like enzyme
LSTIFASRIVVLVIELKDSSGRAQRPKVVVLTSRTTAPPYNVETLKEHVELTWATAETLADALPGAEILFVWDFFSTALRDAWDHADSLRWVHVAAAGVDTLLFDALRESDVVVTNARGAFDGPIAEFVLASILAHDKLLHESKDFQRQGLWRHREGRRTAGRRALVVGTGGIGRATGRLLRAVGLEVMGAGRQARDDDPDFGTVIPTEQMVRHAAWADHVVLIAPLTDQTRGMVGGSVLAAMKPTAHLVNVGRGPLVDEPALIDALRSGAIAAASLDVFDQEPLPADHPFWSMPNVHVSAHMSGDVVGWRDTLADQFADNLARWGRGAELVNAVDKHLGYARGR